MAQENVSRTYEHICLEKLREIGISSAKEWSFSMGYESRNGLAKVIVRIKKNMPEKLKVYNNSTPRLYEAL